MQLFGITCTNTYKTYNFVSYMTVYHNCCAKMNENSTANSPSLYHPPELAVLWALSTYISGIQLEH